MLALAAFFLLGAVLGGMVAARGASAMGGELRRYLEGYLALRIEGAPGTGPSGDMPPRPECAPAWRDALIARLPHIELTLVLGRHALAYHVPGAKGTLADVMRGAASATDPVLVLPHPSPRNQLWLRRNPWFEAEQLPQLRTRVATVLGFAK